MALAVDTAHAHDAHAAPAWRPRANKLGLWMFIASETFLFAAFISSRYILTGTGRPADLNQALALFLTIVLLLSSISAYLGEQAIAHDDRKAFMWGLSITIVLGLGFMIGVCFEWKEALEFFPPSTTFGSTFFMLVGLHAFHVVTGLIGLGFALNMGRKGRFGSKNYWFVEAAVKYWHFVDLAWVVIYPTLYLVGTKTEFPIPGK
ncbi:MAG TPA: heme-copper oxidase subunit III [Ilumatobacteraceae bacterium]|nr:heme-copper oxidase subunit III [Ilumatobacteraceae bacterium]